MASISSSTHSGTIHRQPSTGLVTVALLGIKGTYRCCSKSIAKAGSFDTKQEWLNLGRLREKEWDVQV